MNVPDVAVLSAPKSKTQTAFLACVELYSSAPLAVIVTPVHDRSVKSTYAVVAVSAVA